MGQYYLVVNKTKKQFLYPHAFGDGLKAWEIVASGTMLKALGYLLVTSDGGGGGDLHDNPLVGYWAGDEIVIVGDYDSSKLYDEADATYTDISTTVIFAMTHPKQDIFNDELGMGRAYMKEYFEEHPAIPFEQLSVTGKLQESQIPVTGNDAIKQPAIDPDMLEIM